jgi:hypothetical protein
MGEYTRYTKLPTAIDLACLETIPYDNCSKTDEFIELGEGLKKTPSKQCAVKHGCYCQIGHSSS